MDKIKDTTSNKIFAILVGSAVPAILFGRVILAIIIVLAIIILIFSRLRQPAWRGLTALSRTGLGKLVLLTVGIWLIGAIVQSQFSLKSLEVVFRTMAFVAFAALVHEVLKRQPSLAYASMNALIASTLVCSAIAMVAMTVFPEVYWLIRLKGWITKPLQNELKSFSSLAVLVVPLLAYGAYRRRRFWRLASVIGLAMFLILVWISYNRATMAGLFGGFLAFTVAQLINGRSFWSSYGPAMAFLFCVAAMTHWLLMDRLAYAQQSPQLDWLFPVWLIDFQRQEIWAYTLEVFHSAPWFGVGANTINFVPGAAKTIPGTHGLHIIPSHPHNWGLEVLAETGSLGLLALGIVIATSFAQQFKLYRKYRNYSTLAAIMIMSGYWTSGLFNYSFWSAWWQISFLLIG